MPNPSPMMVLHARAEARAILYAAGDYKSLREATEPLIDYAHKSGLVHDVGIEMVRSLIASIFECEA